MRPPRLAETEKMVKEISNRGPVAMGGLLEEYLETHREYARQTGDGHYLTRSFHRLVERGRHWDPKWALERIKEALSWERSNPYLWIAKARCLEALHEDDAALETLWAARVQLSHSAYIRVELANLLRRGGDLRSSRDVLEEAQQDFPADTGVCALLHRILGEVSGDEGDADAAVDEYRKAVEVAPRHRFGRNGLAAALIRRGREKDRVEAESLLRESKELFPDDPVSRCILADFLKDQERLDEAREIAIAAAEDFPYDGFAPSIAGEVSYIIGLRRGGDPTVKKEAREWFEEAVKRGNHFSVERLKSFDERWDRQIKLGGIGKGVAGQREREVPQRELQFTQTEKEWGPAQRIGRALLYQWQAAHEQEDSKRGGQLFEKARALLEDRGDESAEYFAAFIEARGFLLLARGDFEKAITYFTEQVDRYGRGAWEGIRLGLIEARIRAGKEIEARDLQWFEEPGSEGAITPLLVKVMSSLERDGDLELQSALATLYPIAASHTHATTPKNRLSADTFLASWVKVNWFEPAGVTALRELNDPNKLDQMRKCVSRTAQEFWQATHNVSLALAA
jgi:tetratricopeptide (TPR) repeat protein